MGGVSILFGGVVSQFHWGVVNCWEGCLLGCSVTIPQGCGQLFGEWLLKDRISTVAVVIFMGVSALLLWEIFWW